MSASITLRNTKAEIYAAYCQALVAERQARKDLEAQRMLTSIAEGNAIARASQAADAPRPVRTFMQNGVLMHKVCIGFNRFAIRPAQVAQ